MLVCVFVILQRLYGALQVLVCVFVHFTRTLRSSTGARVCFRAFYKGSTELYGRPFVFPLISQWFYGALRPALRIFMDFVLLVTVRLDSKGSSRVFRQPPEYLLVQVTRGHHLPGLLMDRYPAARLQVARLPRTGHRLPDLEFVAATSAACVPSAPAAHQQPSTSRSRRLSSCRHAFQNHLLKCGHSRATAW